MPPRAEEAKVTSTVSTMTMAKTMKKAKMYWFTFICIDSTCNLLPLELANGFYNKGQSVHHILPGDPERSKSRCSDEGASILPHGGSELFRQVCVAQFEMKVRSNDIERHRLLHDLRLQGHLANEWDFLLWQEPLVDATVYLTVFAAWMCPC